ncbi:MAG: hypothetical protein C0173_08780 [Desulfurella sp.]|nr:MAG: hypothetical protein C0173_08780 [Desulfurella sp.]
MGGILILFDKTVKEYNIQDENILYLIYVMLIGSFFYTSSSVIAFKGKLKIKDYLKNKIKKIYTLFDESFDYHAYKIKVVITFLSLIAIFFIFFLTKKWVLYQCLLKILLQPNSLRENIKKNIGRLLIFLEVR